jgi:hypothetical protein
VVISQLVELEVNRSLCLTNLVLKNVNLSNPFL